MLMSALFQCCYLFILAGNLIQLIKFIDPEEKLNKLLISSVLIWAVYRSVKNLTFFVLF